MLSFISRVIAFLFFSAEAGETHGHFVDMVAYKITKSKNADNTEYLECWLCTPTITWLSGSCGTLLLSRITREYCTAYLWPRTRSKVRIGSMGSTECRSVDMHSAEKF